MAALDSCGIPLNCMAAAKAQEANPVGSDVMLIATDCPAPVAKPIAKSSRKARELGSLIL